MALKERIGIVVSDKMDKTVVVAVINRYPHPTYKKIVSRTTPCQSSAASDVYKRQIDNNPENSSQENTKNIKKSQEEVKQ